MFDSFFFLVKCAFKSVLKNWLLTIASVTVLTFSLLMFGTSLLIIENINVFIDVVGDESQVVIFLDDSLTQEQISSIHQRLLQIQNIKNVNYESKEMALQNYLSMMGENAELFSDISSEILRNSFIFNIRDLTKFDQTMFEINKIDGIARVRERREVISRINDINHLIIGFTFCVIIILLIISIMIITNTVKVSVYSRRVEINIMKYVGATDLFIQMPYFIEGMIIGIISGVTTSFIQYFTYVNIISPIITDFGLFLPVPLQEKIFVMSILFVAIGGIIGVVGSVFPVKKYLNV